MIWKIGVFTAAFFLSVTSYAKKPSIVGISVEKSFVPVGFDDNDRVQVTVAGAFPSTCYKVDTAKATVDAEQKAIRIWQTAYKYGGPCLRMIVPFTDVVDLGIVREGDYNLYDGPSGKWLGKLPITRSSHPGPDDYLYAPVNDAFLITDAAGTKTLTLIGEFSDRCTELKEVRVHYYPEVIVVQPIARRTEIGPCEAMRNRFLKTVPLDPALRGTYLLHVRSMNGQAINKVVDATFLE